MVRVYEQVDVAAIDGSIEACEGAFSLASDEYNREVQESGTLGSGTLLVTSNTSASQRAFHYESEADEPGDTNWPTGTFTIRINVTTGNVNLSQVRWKVCRVNSSGVSQATVAQNFNSDVLNAGVISKNMTGSVQDAALTDRFYVVGLIARTDGHGNQSATITNDQTLTTPFVPKGEVKGVSAMTMLLPTMVASGTATGAGATATSAMTMLIPTMTASGTAAHHATSAMTMLIPTMVASGTVAHVGTSAMTMLIPTMAATGVVNAILGTSAMTMLLPTMVAAGELGHFGTSAMTMLLPTMTAAGVAAHQGTSAMTMLLPTMVAAGKLGHFGTSAMTMPIPTMVASGAVAHQGTSAMTMLIPTMTATGVVVGGSVIVCTDGVWSAPVSYLPCDDFRVTIDGPAADQVKVSATLEFEEP